MTIIHCILGTIRHLSRGRNSRQADLLCVKCGPCFLGLHKKSGVVLFLALTLTAFCGLHSTGNAGPMTNSPVYANQWYILDELEAFRNDYGTITIKQPDVWGQSRIMQHRQEFEQQMAAQLTNFTVTYQGSRQSTVQTSFGNAAGLSAGLGGTLPVLNGVATNGTSTNATIPSLSTNSVISVVNSISNVAIPSNNVQSFGPNASIQLDPDAALDQQAEYIKHLQELRRINEGDDTADAAGYSLYLLRIPVSVDPGQKTGKGYGAEVTLRVLSETATNLLTNTFPRLVINDLGIQLSQALAPLVNATNLPDLYKSVTNALADSTNFSIYDCALPVLAAKLYLPDPNDGISQYVKSNLSQGTVRMLDDYDGDMDSELKMALERDLQRIIQSGDRSPLTTDDITNLASFTLKLNHPAESDRASQYLRRRLSVADTNLTSISEGDLNLQAFVNRLKQTKYDPVTDYIKGRLSTNTWPLPADTSNSNIALLKAFTADLNVIIASQSSLATNHKFAQIVLSAETIDFTNKCTNPVSDDLRRLNRLVLLDACPVELYRKHLLEILDNYEGGSNSALCKALVDGINNFINEKAIYDPLRFAGVNLSQGTLDLLNQNPTNADDLTCLNRLLLADAYPQALAKTRPIYSPSRFSKVKLSESTESLLEKNPQGSELERLNRLLLLDAYRNEFTHESFFGMSSPIQKLLYVRGIYSRSSPNDQCANLRDLYRNFKRAAILQQSVGPFATRNLPLTWAIIPGVTNAQNAANEIVSAPSNDATSAQSNLVTSWNANAREALMQAGSRRSLQEFSLKWTEIDKPLQQAALKTPSGRFSRSRFAFPNNELGNLYGRLDVILLAQKIRDDLGDGGNGPISPLDLQKYLLENLESAYKLLTACEEVHTNPILRTNLGKLPLYVKKLDVPSIERIHNQLEGSLNGATNSDLVTPLLVWPVAIESAMLADKLKEQIRSSGEELNESDFNKDPLLLCPNPRVESAFKRYVLQHWPVHVFALDPTIQDQNIADSSSVRRSLQLSFAFALATGKINASEQANYSKLLTQDLDAIYLNQTIAAFSDGSDKFGWRFLPRFSTQGKPKDQAIDRGMRECTALVILPSFVPKIELETRVRWFGLGLSRKKRTQIGADVLPERTVAQADRRLSRFIFSFCR